MGSSFPPRCAQRFQPGRILASGGFGAVFLATQKGLDRPVVIKLLHADIERDREFVERFKREARVTAALRHPNIVEVVDHDVEEGVPWIAYEYLAGPTVRRRLEEAPFQPEEAIDVARQVCLALQAAHALGVMHRDIKPDNVMAHAQGLWKVTDFGIAHWAGDAQVKTATGIILGTPQYLAPEMILGSPASPSTDIYALGAMLFEMLTGTLPYQGDLRAILTRQKSGQTPRPSAVRADIDPALDAIVLRALAYDAAKRYSAAGAMAEALTRIPSVPPSLPEAGVRTRVLGPVSEGEGATEILAKGTSGRPAHAFPRRGGDPVPGRAGWPAWGRRACAAIAASGVVALALVVAIRGPWRGGHRVVATEMSPDVVPLITGESPLPPRSARIQVKCPSGATAIVAVATGGQSAPVCSVTTRGGPVIVDGLMPGGEYAVTVRSSAGSGVSSSVTMTMPRPMDVTPYATPGETDVIASLWAERPTRVNAHIQNVLQGSTVWRWTGRLDAAHREVVGGLRPDTDYVLVVSPIDPHTYIPFSVTRFTTLPPGGHGSALAFVRRYVSPASPLDSAGDLLVGQEGGRLAQTVDAGCAADALAAAGRPDILGDSARCLAVAEALGQLHLPEALGPLTRMLNHIDVNENLRLVHAMGSTFVPGAVDVLLDVAEGWPLDFSMAKKIAAAAYRAHPGHARERARSIVTDRSRVSQMELAIALSILDLDGDAWSRRTVVDRALSEPTYASILAAARVLREMGTDARIEDVRGILDTLVAKRSIVAGDRGSQSAIHNLLMVLARIGAPGDVSRAIPFLEPPDTLPNFTAAAEVLTRLGGAEGRLRVVKFLGGTEPARARVAAMVLGRARASEACAPILARLADHAASGGRFPRALGLLGNAAAASRLEEAADSSLAALARSTAEGVSSTLVADAAESLWALGRLGDRHALPTLIAGLKSRYWYVRLRAAEALGWLRAPEARSPLSALANLPGEQGVVKGAVMQALRWIQEGLPAGPILIIDPLDTTIDSGIAVVPGDVIVAHVTGAFCDPSELANAQGGGGILQGLAMDTQDFFFMSFQESVEPTFEVHHAGQVMVTTGRLASPIITDVASTMGFWTVWFERRAGAWATPEQALTTEPEHPRASAGPALRPVRRSR